MSSYWTSPLPMLPNPGLLSNKNHKSSSFFFASILKYPTTGLCSSVMSKDILSSQARKAPFYRRNFLSKKKTVPPKGNKPSSSWPPRQDSWMRSKSRNKEKNKNKKLPKVSFKSEETSLEIEGNHFLIFFWLLKDRN